MSENQHAEAVKWLKRAIDAIHHPQQGIFTEDTEFSNMSLLARHTLGEILSQEPRIWLVLSNF